MRSKASEPASTHLLFRAPFLQLISNDSVLKMWSCVISLITLFAIDLYHVESDECADQVSYNPENSRANKLFLK